MGHAVSSRSGHQGLDCSPPGRLHRTLATPEPEDRDESVMVQAGPLRASGNWRYGHFMAWAFVEVSRNGSDVARLDAVSAYTAPVAGAGASGWGATFDLAELAEHPLVTGGPLDLGHIQSARLADIPGSGDCLDSLNNPILDAHSATGSGGSDFRFSERVAVIHEGPEPTAMVLLGVGLLATRRRGRSSSRSVRIGSGRFPLCCTL